MSQPTVTTTSPLNSATNVVIDTTITITFDQNIAASTVNAGTITVFRDSDFEVLESRFSVSDNVITINPYDTLPKNTTISVVLRGGSRGVKNGSGEYLATTYNFKFTTGTSYATPGPTVPDIPTYPDGIGDSVIDPTSPAASGTGYDTPLTPDAFYIISTTPTASTSNVEPSGLTIQIAFNAPPKASLLESKITIYGEPVNGDYSLFRPKEIPGSWSVSGNIAIFTPD